MRKIGIALLGWILAACSAGADESPATAGMNADENMTSWSIALHGGAGVITPDAMTPEREAAYRDALSRAIQAGAEVLNSGQSALDAVEASIRVLEDDPLFNAGHGAVFTATGRHELDASIMDGETLKAGAVAGVSTVRYPLSLARLVMEQSPHVMMQGVGAEEFANEQGVERIANGALSTQRRWNSLMRTLTDQGRPLPGPPDGFVPQSADEEPEDKGDARKHGTVGVVARDRKGNLAAGTSTGGMTGKRFGRVGDSPVIGAGTYADNRACAVSATGWGEYFIRLGIAQRICLRMQLAAESAQVAGDHVIHQELGPLGGDGGVIIMDPQGGVAYSFNTAGMYRARQSEGEPLRIGIYGAASEH
jgi:L-asparaginase / beta-aspartyl-peptidase